MVGELPLIRQVAKKMELHPDTRAGTDVMSEFVTGFSIEVMPKTAAKIADFRDILPDGTRIYVANIEGTSADDMIATARRIAEEGFPVVPHVTARTVRTRSELQDLAARYREVAGVREVLLLAGGAARPYGEFDSAVQLLETHIFDRAGFTRAFVAGHPEGNRDIDAGGGYAETDRALRQKQRIADNSDMAMELTTQFVFDAAPVISWTERIRKMGVTLPINVGVAGPTKLRTLLKYAIACGVGPSIRIIQRRARDIAKLLTPMTPDDVVEDLAGFKRQHPDSAITRLHIFPLGGIKASAGWATTHATRVRNANHGSSG